MLVSSKKRHEKIVLGFLSYTYDEETPSLEEQEKVLEAYRQDEACQIYLYKNESSDNFLGLAILLLDQQILDGNESKSSTTIIIDRVAISPSYRNEGWGYQMYKEIRTLYPNAAVMGSNQTMETVTAWTHKYRLEQSGAF